MSIKLKRYMMLIALAAATAWNGLCLLGVLPRFYFKLSVFALAGYSAAMVFVPLLFPAFRTAGGTSSAYSELTPKEKRLSLVTIGLALAWIVTLAVCVAYSG
ncbi:hypothetical protein [Oscillibacter sp.]|uniref:hypothetical protein n=1 Tax=Oscillibacter sp. TaxID=1945593 RepID=UPI00289A3DDB|nr:hypothetical protein [Oscillibacter sp.]